MAAKKIGIILAVVLIVGLVVYLISSKSTPSEKVQEEKSVAEEVISSNMQLKSSAFDNQGQIPSKYTCDAENISPPLTISDVPEGTQGLALIVDDPDAPVGDWVHWLVWNIDPETKEIGEGHSPAASVQGLNDFGNNDYGGPCPPSGTHRYQFKLYALDTTLDLSESSKKKDLLNAMQGHILGQSLLVGLYQRQ